MSDIDETTQMILDAAFEWSLDEAIVRLGQLGEHAGRVGGSVYVYKTELERWRNIMERSRAIWLADR